MMFALIFLLVALDAASCGVPPKVASLIDAESNANHIFNSVHDSMRQLGNSLNHNGMSFFYATVPRDTEFYHGTSQSEPVSGMQWLAFEPEHALAFVRPAKRIPDNGDSKTATHHRQRRGRRLIKQDPILDEPLLDEKPMPDYGFLHTYRTKHELRLIYFDGQSAAKSTLGTLDTQDIIVRDKDDRDAPSPIQGDRDRANDLCDIAKSAWKGRIDGFVRMVGGFELILCSFDRNLEVVHIKAVPNANSQVPGESLNYQRAIASRNHGIGGNRVSVDYDNFMSMFAYPQAIFLDRLNRPRILNDHADIPAIRAELSAFVLGKTKRSVGTNWQVVTEMIVTRYAHHIQYLTSGRLETLAAVHAQLSSILKPFMDVRDRDDSAAVERCTAQFWPSNTNTSTVAAVSVKTVSKAICSTFFEALAIKEYHDAIKLLRTLEDYLGWTVWKECNGCQVDEVCKLPIWPSGDAEDFKQLKCSNDFSHGRGDYWDFSGRPRPIVV